MAPQPIVARRRLNAPRTARISCLVAKDFGMQRYPAVDFFRLPDKRDISHAARLCEQFSQQNLPALDQMHCKLFSQFDGNQIFLTLQAGSMVGAVPLKSPTQAAFDYGLVVQPRFAWSGIGPMLSEMGWNVVPRPLKMPIMKTSERRVPPWVLSSMILQRLKGLLDSLNRRFEMTTELRTAPKGQVEWASYVVTHVSHGQLLSIPCTFPDLREDRTLRSAIRFTLEQHLSALGTQRSQGKFVHDLLDLCLGLLNRVRDVPPSIPTALTMQAWSRASLLSESVINGLQAIEWTIEERGLAGLSELNGLPWIMPMEEFYESWVETVLRIVARQTGCILKTGRRKETTRPIAWEPAYLGSQKSLVPDLWMERPDLTLIVDAKYKRHWEELRTHSWHDFEEEMREHHRNDLMQALAYANLSTTTRTVTCLAYPCSRDSWEDMKARKRIVHKAAISSGDRSLELWLIAVPMAVPATEVAAVLCDAVGTVSQ
jgi:hypothetical protein